ncbi:MAG TPA: alpha/beta hydrolase, partial [Gammaproteobacteria bacterium]|nr:alpha/beta hydrolase [Gammaproteobacteria bacterium]
MSETKYLDVDGVRLETLWIGPRPAEAPTLVLLHEGLGSVSLWKDFPQRLAELSGWGVLAYSRQGYGRSDPVEVPRPLSYMHHEGLEVLPKLLNAAGIRQTILVGHSDGASIALINAGGVQDPRVIGAVLMAPHVLTEEISVASIRQARTAYEQGKLRESLKRHH